MTDLKKTLRDSAAMRWLVLVLISGMMFATYWFYDVFSSLKPHLLRELDISNAQFGIIYSAATWANVLGMIILGGVILDRWGIRIASSVFGLLTTVGAGLVALGSSDLVTSDSTTKLVIFIVGRVLFGSGIEIICVIISRTVVKWFMGKELALAMAVNVGFGRVGSALAISLSPSIAGNRLAPALTFAAGLVLAGFLLLMAYLILDVKIDRQIGAEKEEEDPFRLSDLWKLVSNPSFLFITLLCVTFYSAVFPFITFAPDLLHHKFGFTMEMPDFGGLSFWEKIKLYVQHAPTNGPQVAALIPFGTILFTPIFGAFVDRKGRAASLMIIGGGLLIFAHLSLSVFDSRGLGYAGLLSLGIAFSLVPAAMWPAVAKIIPENRLGTAYASMFTIQAFGLASVPILIGWILDLTNDEIGRSVVSGFNAMGQKLVPSGEELGISVAIGFEAMSNQAFGPSKELAAKLGGWSIPLDYTLPILLCVGLGVAAIAMSFMLKAADRKQGYGLELPSSAEAPASETN